MHEYFLSRNFGPVRTTVIPSLLPPPTRTILLSTVIISFHCFSEENQYDRPFTVAILYAMDWNGIVGTIHTMFLKDSFWILDALLKTPKEIAGPLELSNVHYGTSRTSNHEEKWRL